MPYSLKFPFYKFKNKNKRASPILLLQKLHNFFTNLLIKKKL
jgi:hypothetical protein